MMRYSANLGFLWTELALADAVGAAHAAGFGALECHFPYDTAPEDLNAALSRTGLSMLALHTCPGDRDAGEFGLAALPGREEEARAGIARAVDYAAATGMRAIHVMAGRTDGGARAEGTFRANLAHACDLAGSRALSVYVEPINTRDVPGYHLSGTDHAERIIDALGRTELRLMFDCYHMGIMQGDLARSLERLLPVIGHVQIAAVPDRGEPDAGEVDYAWLMRHHEDLGYEGHVGAEYKPRAPGGSTEAGLAWLGDLRGGR